MKPLAPLLVVASLSVPDPASAAAKEPVPDALLRTLCRFRAGQGLPGESPYLGVLRDAEGRYGGFVLHSGVLDSPIAFHDRSGSYLTTFHIFGSDEEKRAASAIIDPLTAKFPHQEALECPQERWPRRPLRP
jgi:hypothetical protein